MDDRTMKHAAKLAEWSEKVQACRSSGLTIKDWCEQNNVCDHVQVSHVLDNVPLGVLFSPSLASLVAQTVKNLPAMEET